MFSTIKEFLELRTLRRSEDKNDENGLALLDVLIGMAIFALIALIALSALGQYREKAFMTGASSDAKAVGQAIEAEQINQQNYPTTLNGAAGATDYVGVYGAGACSATVPCPKLSKVTKGNEVLYYSVIAPTATDPAGFAFCIQHRSNGAADAYAIYNSLKGGLVKQATANTVCGGSATAAAVAAVNP